MGMATYSPTRYTEYLGAKGIEGEPCKHAPNRIGIGPWPGASRGKDFMITVDQCAYCGRIMRSWGRHITWQEYIWVRRWNAHRAEHGGKNE